MRAAQVEVRSGVGVGTLAAGDEPGPAAPEVDLGAARREPQRLVEVGQGAVPVAQGLPGAAAVGMGVRPARIEADGLVERSDRLAEPALTLQGQAEAEVRPDEPGLQPQGLDEVGDGSRG